MRSRLVAALTVAAAVLLVATPAVAHDETGEFSAVRAEPTGNGLAVTVDVLLTYTNDGHGATDAVVTLTAAGPDDGAAPVVTMTSGDREGAYTADLTLPAPGDWTLTVSAPDPQATRTFPVTVAAPTTTTTTESPVTSESRTATVASDDADDSEESAPWWTALIFAGIGGVIGALFVRWRKARVAE